MAVFETMAILLALTALAMLPCLVVFLIFADAFLNVVRVQRLRIERARQQMSGSSEALDEGEQLDPAGPPLEQIATEIHRLTYARRTATVGTARFIAATRAYDRRLGHACRALEIDEHLTGLDGFDLEVERLRVEGLLLDAGFVLDTDSARPA